MNRQSLAKKLQKLKTDRERQRLLSGHASLADKKLAQILKENCYSVWTSRPTEARETALAARSLAKFNPADDVRAYSFWVNGIAQLTLGKLESTITNLDSGAELFLKAGNPLEAANTQVAKLYALALLGKYDEAVQCGQQALKVFEQFGDEIAAGKVEKNLGNLAARQGDELRAVEFYLSARKRFIDGGDREELAMAENSLANSYAELNDFVAAEKYYASALVRASEEEMSVTVAEIEASLGNLAAFRGKFDEALRFLEASRRKYESLDMPHQTAIAELESADIYLELNLATEAFAIYETLVPQLRRLKLRAEEARARANFGRAAIVAGNFKTAREELRRAVRLFRKEENLNGVISTGLLLAELALKNQNFSDAEKLIDSHLDHVGKLQNVRLSMRLRLKYADVLRRRGRLNEAKDVLRKLAGDSELGEQRTVWLESLNMLGEIELLQQNDAAAEDYFKQAVSIVEELRAPLPADEFRIAFLSDKITPFENLAQCYIQAGEIGKAFTAIEQARGRALSDSLADTKASEDLSPGDRKIRLEIERLREELNWFYSRGNRAEGEDAELFAEASKREKQIAALSRRLSSSSQNSRTSGSSPVISLNDLKKQLGETRVLIEFANFEGKISAFAVSDREISFFPELAAEDEIFTVLEDLRFQFDALRFGTAPVEKFLPQLKSRADRHLEKLYELLLAPLESHLVGKNIVIVPVGSLHYVPFNALIKNEKYLIEDHTVNIAPSAAVWKRLDGKRIQNGKNALLVGFADEQIPLVEKEIGAIAKLFENPKKLTGKMATFGNFTKAAGDFDILHLACHGNFRPENPLYSNLHLADGNITVRDLTTAKLRAGLVVLSACETGLNKIFAGEEILGLARGFLTAGASSLVLSLWTVNDEMTASLMREFYKHLQRGGSVTASLQKAQKKLITSGAHPYFWAPFAAVGK